jgi:hypothetical protein|mmetsp:Transcript_29911/g.54125  ORF Transcript_29911/g.54125 Transcript_29911/m.54125 type:complete len:223 (+) Transcript_29911:393-1061(+)|eukprot:CAMPEP_0202483896 /NCGR_PEP_ID=MMETSP1361-20130828/3057_1 /ASSEMBLY_ACC=CAM_ASM_000849 /TAXON_ID=210615 /ORGANISM="Staurosira complex sp., Strain CCMP2646" /LENGTH=222 /DNA_ID=CAMNT_0049112331 /DNA_START=282 /DNA_END=950 /DNA_ORIENTATION=+
MGILLSRLRIGVKTKVSPLPSPPCDLPVDVYTCILEFFLLLDSNDIDYNDNVNSILSLRLVCKSTKLAFDKIRGWNALHDMYTRRVEFLTRKIGLLQATIANPPPLFCILKFDAYLTCCWTLKNELSLERNVIQEDVLVHIANKIYDNENGGMTTLVVKTATSTSTTTIIPKENYNKNTSLVLISEWHGYECVLKFEFIRDDCLQGFSLPAIDSSELPFVVA